MVKQLQKKLDGIIIKAKEAEQKNVHDSFWKNRMNHNLHRKASELISQSRDASNEKSKEIQKLED